MKAIWKDRIFLYN